MAKFHEVQADMRSAFEDVSLGLWDLETAVAVVLENDMARHQRLRSVTQRAVDALRQRRGVLPLHGRVK